MLLSEGGSLAPMLKVAFTVFFAFWAVVLVTLYIAVGLLLKHRERRGQHGHEERH
jgi:hypothetical protein